VSGGFTLLLMGSAVGLVLGLLLGGRISALINVRLRFAVLIAAAVTLRFGTQIAIAQGVDLADALRWPLYASAFGALVGALVGLGFHLLNQAAGHLGVVYEVHPILSAAGPALLMSVVAAVLLSKTP